MVSVSLQLNRFSEQVLRVANTYETMIYNIAPEETDFFGNLYSQCVHMFQFSGGSMIGTKEGLNKEDLRLKLKIKVEFTLSYSI